MPKKKHKSNEDKNKEREKKNKIFMNNFKKSIKDNKNILPINFNDNIKNIKTSTSRLDINYYDSKTIHNPNINNNIKEKKKRTRKYRKDTSDQILKSKKIEMKLTDEQKLILNKWFDCYTKMYNQAVRHIKDTFLFTKREILKEDIKKEHKEYFEFEKLRKKMYDITLKIQEESIINNTKIDIHTLNKAVDQLASNLKSAISNLREGNIEKFRIRYWKNNRLSKTMELEKQKIRNNKLCHNVFGDIKYIYDKKEYILNNTNYDFKINYNKIENKYYLILLKDAKKEENKKKKKLKEEIKKNKIGNFDIGFRKILSGVSEDKSIFIGTKIFNEISDDLIKIKDIKNNDNLSKKKKKKYEIKKNIKIINKIDDFQWKTIKYLVNNYEIIVLGDMNIKSIISKKNKVLSKLQKETAQRMKFFEFKSRLEYKCKASGTKFIKVNEYMTSKTCSICGNIKEIGASEIYECTKCNNLLDRDINSARNMYIKYLML